MVERQQQSAKSAEDNKLLLYRIEQVEKKIDNISLKFDNMDAPKRVDLIEFRDTIVSRVNEIREGLQKQIDEKADKSAVDDLRTLVKAVASALTSILVAIIIFYLTRGN